MLKHGANLMLFISPCFSMVNHRYGELTMTNQ